MLHDGVHGCSTEEHTVKLQQHITRHGNNHHSLDQSFSDPSFPSVLPLSGFLTSERLERQQAPTRRQWKELFCGIPARGRQQFPRQVCLHAEETQDIPPLVAFDVDSLLGFASSLTFARQGISYQPAPQVHQNLRTDVHLEGTAYESQATAEHPDLPSRAKPAMLKDIPHHYLGRVEGASDISLFILFPHLEFAHQDFIGLTNEQHARWLDRVLHPAIYDHYAADYTQHLPASHRQSVANNKARQVEDRVASGASYQTQQLLHYHLQPERLPLIWEQVRHVTSHTPGLQDFRDPQLFFSAKGTKLQFKTSPSRPTLLDAIDNFQAYFERVIDLDHVYLDRFYIDLGREVCTPVSFLSHMRPGIDGEAQVYLWRQCCLEQHLQWLYDGSRPRSGQTFYHVSMLRDACNLTSLTPKRSRLRQGGLIYSQFYSSVKEMTDAAKSYPFQNDGLEEMALDPQIRQGARNAGRSLGRRDLPVIEKAYHASKRRTLFALTDSCNKSFGVREEHRIAWPLLLALKRRLEREGRENLEIILDACPSTVWPIRTSVYTQFLYRNVDKFATGFEVALARCQRDYVTWEQTKIMAMFLRCLRFALNAHRFSREAALWWGTRETTDANRPRTWYGLGFSNTLPRYGYAWMEPRIDFERLTFHVDVTDHMLFGNRTLRSRYLRRGGQVRDFHDNFLRLELALGWLQVHHATRSVSRRLVVWITHLCLQQFRLDTLATVSNEIRGDQRTVALEGLRPFSYEYFEEIMAQPLHAASGNKSAFKDPLALAHMLFDYDDGRTRTHWEHKPYRKLYRRACHALRSQPLTNPMVREFQSSLWSSLFKYHWILPYPGKDVFTQTTKGGERIWYLIQPGPAADIWVWGRKDWLEGDPAEFPDYIQWPKEQWEAWIERQ